MGRKTVRVLCLVTLPTSGAGNRLRVEQYAALLRDQGIELVIAPFFDEDAYSILYRPGGTLARVVGTLKGTARRLRDAVRVGRSDLVLVYRESAPLGPPLFERYLGLRGKRYVYDFDDALFVGSIHPANQRWAWLRHPSRYAEAVRRSRIAIAATPYLADWARAQGAEVVVIPTPVDTARFVPGPPRPAGGPMVIGWIGSSTTSEYLHILDDVFDRLAGRLDLVVRVVGGTYSHPRVPVEVLPWSLAREPEDVAGFDIGVLPEPDDPWTRGKSAHKAMLYMSAAVPVVASAIGVNPDVVPDGRVGYCVSDADGWVAAIERLAADRELRARLGAEGRRWVEARYSLAGLAPKLADVLEQAARRGT